MDRKDTGQTRWTHSLGGSSLVDQQGILLIFQEMAQSDLIQHLKRHLKIYEPRYDIYNYVVCATSKASDQHAHMRSLTKAFASRFNIL